MQSPICTLHPLPGRSEVGVDVRKDAFGDILVDSGAEYRGAILVNMLSPVTCTEMLMRTGPIARHRTSAS